MDYCDGFKMLTDIITKDGTDYQIAEALAHKVMLEVGKAKYAHMSMAAICSHIRTEKKNPGFKKVYSEVFKDKHFCQRILMDWPI